MQNLMAKKPPQKKKKENSAFKPHRIKIRVVGVGGGASSIIKEMASSLKNLSFVAADTDNRTFKKLPRLIRKFKFGEELTRGWGTGMNVELGELAAQNSKDKIKKLFEGFDLVILVGCLGGGVSSGALPVFAETLRDSKKLSLGIFTLPFDFEGEKKLKIAKESLDKVKDYLSAVIVLPNEYILKLSDKKTSLRKSLSLMNKFLIDYLKDLIETISLPGVINIDFADLRAVLKGKRQICLFGRGTSLGPNKVEEALKEIFENPFLVTPKKIKKILFNITGGEQLALKDVEAAAVEISKLNPKAKIIFGISKDKKMGRKVKITLFAVGEDFQQKERSAEQKEKEKKPKKEASKKEKVKKAERKKKPPSKAASEKAKKKRRSALEIKKEEKLEEEKEWWQESDWEIPAFLRDKEE
jgi:cell division protein FtsZ